MSKLEQGELEAYLGKSADILYGVISPEHYKEYIFPLLFFKRISDIYDEETQNALKISGGDIEYAKIQGYVAQSNSDTLQEQLNKGIDLLDLTDWQKQKLHELSINTIGELIDTPEERLKKVRYIADVRARNIKNAGIAAVCEYLLG